MATISMYVDDELLLKRLEYLVVCFGLAYAFTIRSVAFPAALLTGVCLLVVFSLYFLEVRLVTRTNEAAVRRFARSASSLGLWCCVLLPICLFLSCHSNFGSTCSESYNIVSLVSTGLILPSVLGICNVIYKPGNSFVVYIACVLGSALISTVIIFYWFSVPDLGIYGCFFLILFLIIIFDLVLNRLLLSAPRSFTFGEAVIVSQGFVIFSISAVLNVYHKGYCDIDHMENAHIDYSRFKGSNDELEYQEVGDFVNTSLVACTTLVLSLFVHKWFRSPKGFYFTAIFLGVLFISVILGFSLEKNPAIWLYNFFETTSTRIVILCLWAAAVWSCVFFVIFQPRSTNTATRKCFHIAVLAIFIPGLLYDQSMLYLASTLISGILVIVECIRVLNIPPLGEFIRKSLMVFIDEKDAGPLVLTHIYLLVGCSLPLWMSPYFKSNGSPAPLVVFSGILSVAVGDTVASVFGTYLGRHSWPGTKKTVAGTCSSIVAQVLFCSSMDGLGYINAPVSKYACAVITSSLLEAFTLQIDNLTLPLFLYFMLL